MKEFHVNDGPFLKSNNGTRKIMRNLFIALLPIIIFAVYKNGIIPYINGKTDLFGLCYPLLFILIPTITTFIVELLYAVIILKKKSQELIKHIKSCFSIFPGLFLGLILPINTPIAIVIFGAVVATIIGKLVYGGFGHNIFNPALIGRIFIIATYAAVISSSGGYLNSYEVDTISTSTPLSNASTIEGIGTYETLVEPYGNMFDFFVGTIPGAVGETSSLLCLLALIFLSLTKTIKWKIPVVYILTVFGITLMIGNINGLGIWYPLFQILSGGLMFGAVFMATDPVTSPVTPIGQVLYGLFLGILTVIFRYLTPYPEGVLTSILTMNLFVVILDKIGSRARFNFKKCLIPFFFAWLLIIGSGFYIGNKYNNTEITDPDYHIISKEEVGNKVIYTATQKGYIGDIKATISIENGEVVEFKVLEQTESFYSKIEAAKYTEQILKKQQELDKLDAVSGATITSNALKKLITNTLKDYITNGGTAYEADPNFNVISSEKQEDKVIYEVTQKGCEGDIKLRIVFKLNVIDSITVIEQKDSYFNMIVDKNYITKLVENQQVLDGLDTVSGATVTSNSLKRAVINTKKDYFKNYEG